MTSGDLDVGARSTKNYRPSNGPNVLLTAKYEVNRLKRSRVMRAQTYIHTYKQTVQRTDFPIPLGIGK